MTRILFAMLLAFALTGTAGASHATIIEIGDLNFINQVGNPSDGLAYLDMTFSDGRTLADALTNAQATYPTARLATPSETDDLFLAAGVSYTTSLRPSDAYLVGGGSRLTGPADAGVMLLASSLGDTRNEGAPNASTWWFADPDGSNASGTTRDYISLGSADRASIRQNVTMPAHVNFGWLLVAPGAALPAPEPSTAFLLGGGLIALAMRRRSVHGRRTAS